MLIANTRLLCDGVNANIVILGVNGPYCKLTVIIWQILKDKISKDLPLQDDDDAGGLIEMQQSLLTAWKMQLKDLQRAHHLIGNYIHIPF